MTTYTTEAIACGLSDVAGWLENEGGREKHARTIRLGVERLRELGAASQPVIVGWHSIAKLAAEGEVRFDESPVALIAASDLYGNDIAALRASAAPSHPGEAEEYFDDWAAQLAHNILRPHNVGFEMHDVVATELRRIEATGYTRGYEACQKAAPSHPGEADRVGLGDLERLSAEAPAGLWRAVCWGNERYPYPMSIVTADDQAWVARDGTASSASTSAFIVALVNAYRSGKLVPASLAALDTGEGSGGASFGSGSCEPGPAVPASGFDPSRFPGAGQRGAPMTALTDADHLREALIACLAERFFREPGQCGGHADALIAGPLATLRARATAAEAERDEALAVAKNRDAVSDAALESSDWAHLQTILAEDKLRDREAEIERLRGALKPFATLSFSFDGFSIDPAVLVFAGREVGPWWPDQHAAFESLIKAARAALASTEPHASSEEAIDAQ